MSLHSTQKIGSLALIAAALFVAPSCSTQAEDDAEALWERIQGIGYRSWMRAPGYETRKASNAPHSDNVDIFVNDKVETALASTTALTSWPVGSFIIKDGYDSGGDLAIVAAMEKTSSGWTYTEWDGDGEIIVAGEDDKCTSCHKASNDHVLAFPLPDGKPDDDESALDAATFWQRINDADYQTWARPQGWESTKPTGGPHGDAANLYYNDVLEAAATGSTALTAWPDGSFVVKDILDGNNTLTHVAAAEKIEGAWYWAEYKADGTPLASGSPAGCTGCHASGDDSLRAIALP